MYVYKINFFFSHVYLHMFYDYLFIHNNSFFTAPESGSRPKYTYKYDCDACCRAEYFLTVV